MTSLPFYLFAADALLIVQGAWMCTLLYLLWKRRRAIASNSTPSHLLHMHAYHEQMIDGTTTVPCRTISPSSRYPLRRVTRARVRTSHLHPSSKALPSLA